MANRVLLHIVRRLLATGHPFQMPVSCDPDHFGTQAQIDGRMLLDTQDQVSGHGVGQALGPHEHVDALGGLRQEHGGLPSRIPASHDDDLLPAAELPFHGGRAEVHARAFEPGDIIDGKPSILGARRDDHRARRHLLLSDRHDIGPSTALEPRRDPGHEKVGPELPSLGVRCRGELVPRDAGGEPEIVLDLRARARLPAGRRGFHHEYVEPLGSAVDRGREAGRPGAHDDEVPGFRDVHRRVEAQTVGDLLIARIAEDLVPPADEHRDVRDGDVEALHQLFDVRLAIEIDLRVGVVVAGQEVAYSQRAGAMIGSDENRVAEVALDQAQAAKDEGAHDDVAQLRVGLNDHAQILELDLDDFAGFDCLDPDQREPARERTDLARELAGTQLGEPVVAPVGGSHHVQKTPRHHPDSTGFLTDVEKDLSLGDGAFAAVGGGTLQLPGGEHRKQFWVDERRGLRFRHD